MAYRNHTAESLAEIASNFNRRSDFAKSDFSAYQMCRYYGLLDTFFPDSAGFGKQNDAVYLMRAVGFMHERDGVLLPVYKFGATSSRLPKQCRSIQQKICSGISHEYEIPQTQVVGKATTIEKFAKHLGVPVFEGTEMRFPGHTEYRAYTPEDVQAIKDMVELCRV